MNPNTLRIISIVQARVDAFLKDLFDIYKSSEDDLTMKTPSDAIATKTAICDAVEIVVRRRRNECALFSRLDVDVVHSIFGAALDVDLVHDSEFLLENLDRHRHQLFQMRCVSTSWNKFLLSSPRYWRVINIKSSAMVTSKTIQRSGSGSLCIYCIKALPPPMTEFQSVSEELRSCIPRIQTLRSDDPDAYLLCRHLLRTRTPALRTLKLLGNTSPSTEILVEPLGDLSPVRHLTGVSWRPPSNAAWLTGLRELILVHLSKLDTDIILVLSVCTSLELLYVRCDDDMVIEDLSGAPSLITLPCLQTMDLAFDSDESAVNIIRRLVASQILRALLEITQVTMDLDRYIADYCRFMSPGEKCIQHPNSAIIIIKSLSNGQTRLVYGTESHQVTFGMNPEEALAFHDLVQEFQSLLKGPPLTVTIFKPSIRNWLFLKSLEDQNIRSIAAHHCKQVVPLLTAIGASTNNAPTDTMESATIIWPFESLKSLTIHDADLNVSQITRLVGIRQQYLREHSKRWVEEIVLVKCRLKGMRLPKAVKQLAAMGVTLRGVGCSRM